MLRFTAICLLVLTIGCGGPDITDSAPKDSGKPDPSLTASGAFPAIEAAKRLPLEVCEIPDIEEPLLCGVFEVFENRETNAGRKVPISIVIIPAQEERNTKTAWIEHPGGPRYSSVATAGYFAKGGWLESFRRNRDVVLVDVRGLHASGPLYCDALKAPRILERYYPPERVRACREELEPHADLAQYSTLNAIADYEDIRTWLGYEQWDVGGWSYGSRFMLTYLHKNPDSIRTISLFIPSILNFERPVDYARFGQQAFDRLSADCKADDACNQRFPDVAGDLATTFSSLEAAPVTISFADPDGGEDISRLIDRNIFAETIWIALLSNRDARQLPYVLRHSAQGDFAPFTEFAAPKSPEEQEPEGHYFSITCPEETGRLTREQAAEAAKDTFIGSYIAEDYIGACEAWGLPLHPGHPITPEVFDVPALIVTGDQDPVTPPQYGDINAGHFENKIHITVPHMAHGEGGFENEGCLGAILDDFVSAGIVDGLDVSCVETMRPPPFRLE